MGACLQDGVYHPLLRFDNGDPVTDTPAQRWVKYCDLMKQPREWGDETCITAACNYYHYPFTVITHGAPPTHYTPANPDSIVAGVEIFLGHIHERHYVCLALGMLSLH